MKAKKLTKDELKDIQDHVGKLNQLYIEIGRIEHQKNKFSEQVSNLDEEFKSVQSEIEKKYGKCSINIDNGELSEIKSDE